MFTKRKTDPANAFADPLNAAVAHRDQGILDMVRQAIRHQDCFLVYQPIVQAENPTRTGFFEGFIRILDDTGRVIPAADFMPHVEDDELGREIDTLALKIGCRALHTDPVLRLSINMSARSIGYQPWLKALNWWLRKDEDLGPRLILEITEASAMQMPEIVIDFINAQQPCGISFALDDFGAGQMNLRYLRDFMFDMVKIDGQFIRGIAQHPDNQVLTETLLDVADRFDMLTVAESVENEADAHYLRALGVDCMQGYLFGAPTPQPEVALDRRSHSKIA